MPCLPYNTKDHAVNTAVCSPAGRVRYGVHQLLLGHVTFTPPVHPALCGTTLPHGAHITGMKGSAPTPLGAEDLQRSGIFRHRFLSSPPLINTPNHLRLPGWTQGYFIRWVIILHDFMALQLWSYLPLCGPLLSL